MWGDYSDELFKSIKYPRLLLGVLYFLLPNIWRLVDISSHILLSSDNVGYFGTYRLLLACASPTTLLPCVFLIQWLPKASNELVWDVQGWVDRVFNWCKAIPGHCVFDISAFSNMVHNTVNGLLLNLLCTFLCGNLSSAFVIVVLLVMIVAMWVSC